MTGGSVKQADTLHACREASGGSLTDMPFRSAYRVGGHTFAIEYPAGMLSEKELQSYAPFRTEYSGNNKDNLFSLRLMAESNAIPAPDSSALRLEDENGVIRLSSYQDGCLALSFSSPAGCECCRLSTAPDFRTAKAWIGGSAVQRRYALDSALMLLYAFAASPLDTLIVHASAIECHGKAYIFLGKSGTGKSTHSRLWLQHVEGSSLLNDDNPILRVIDGTTYVFGSPWSGKTHCHLNLGFPLCGIVRLSQAPVNRIGRLTGVKAYAALLPSCSGMKWDHTMAESIHATCCKVIGMVPVFSLECLPDKDAALLSHETMTDGQ